MNLSFHDPQSTRCCTTAESTQMVRMTIRAGRILGTVGLATVVAAGIASSSGAATGDLATEILITPARAEAVDVAATPDSFLVTWRERSATGTSLLARVVTNDGEVGAPIVLTNTAGGASFASAGGHDAFLVTWRHQGLLVGVRISSSGTVLDHEPFVIGGRVECCSDFEEHAVWNGTEWAIVWLEEQGDELYIFLTHVAADGTVESPGHSIRGYGVGDIAWNGREYLVAAETGDHTATIVGLDGETRAEIPLIDGAQISSIGRLGDDFVVTYYAGEPEVSPGYWSVVLDGDGAIQADTRRFLGPYVSHAPSVASEDGSFTVFERMGTDEPDLYVGDVRILAAAWGAAAAVGDDVALVAAVSTRGVIARRVPRDGPIPPATPFPPRTDPTPLPPVAMTLGPVTQVAEGSAASVASNDRIFLVTWNFSQYVWAQAVDADGTAARSAVRLGYGGGPVGIGTSDDGTFLLVWTAQSEVRSRRLAADGAPIDEERVLWNATDWPSIPAVTFADGRWLVAFDADGSLVTLLIDREGAVVDEAVSDNAIYSGISFIAVGDAVFLASSRTLFRLEGIDIVRPGVPLVPVWAGAANDGWSVATQHGRSVFAYDCERDCSEAEPPSAFARKSTWTVELDTDGRPIEATRRRHSEPASLQPRVVASPRILVAGYRYDGSPWSVFVDDVLVLPGAQNAEIAVRGESALVVATDASGHVVMRWIRFPPPDWRAIPVPSPDSDRKPLFGCAVAPSNEPLGLTFLLAALASCALRRSKPR